MPPALFLSGSTCSDFFSHHMDGILNMLMDSDSSNSERESFSVLSQVVDLVAAVKGLR